MSDHSVLEAQPSAPTLRVSVGSTANRLQRNYLERSQTPAGAEARAQLAELRKFSGRNVQDFPIALENVLLMLNPPLSEQELGKGNAPSPSEEAAFYALTLFGTHMQGARKPMHSAEIPFATACGRLFARSSSNSIKPRFDAMQAAADETARMQHLRSLVTLLRSQDLSFDYGRFAEDLRALQKPNRKNAILLRWGRQFVQGAQPQRKSAQ